MENFTIYKKRALVSVYDKSGVVEFARGLAGLGFEIVSTGGTARALSDAGVPTVEAQSVTGFPECLGGRVKTLHPKIHGGLLAVRADQGHMREMREQGIGMIDLVAANLYPFLSVAEKPGATFDEAVENIDIGGPAMIRSAAKNHRDVTVVVDPADYPRVLAALEPSGADGGVGGGGGAADGGVGGGSGSGGGGADGHLRRLNLELAQKAFEHTASYDAIIAQYLAAQAQAHAQKADAGAGADSSAGDDAGAGAGQATAFRDRLTLTFIKAQQMRYGENPHQSAAFYRDPFPEPGSLAAFEQFHGKELSYNNINDLDGALAALREFDAPTVVAAKHANPCGVGCAGDICGAYIKAVESDAESAYGGIIAANRAVDAPMARQIGDMFIEAVAAPAFDEEALRILMRKKNIRLLKVGTGAAREAYKLLGAAPPAFAPIETKKVYGGLLAQTRDAAAAERPAWRIVTLAKPSAGQAADLLFAMAVVKHVKSNAIVLAKGGATVGIGPGQTSRVMAAKIALERAGARASGSVAASDAFFPFPDCVEAFAKAGVAAVIQPGGSVNDGASIEACDRHGIAMAFTGVRHFLH